MRSPVDRAISTYNHFVRRGRWTGSFREFASAARFRNPLGRLLADVDLERFGFIGFTEQFDAAFAALGEFAGAAVPVRQDNIGKYKGDNSGIRDDPDCRAVAAELNADDMALYERLKRRRASAPRAAGAAASVSGETGAALRWRRTASHRACC